MERCVLVQEEKNAQPQFIKPFEILDRIGHVAYHIALPPGLSQFHNVFHASVFSKYIAEPSHVLDYQSIQISEDLSYEEQPIKIVHRKEKVLRTRVILLVKVHWMKHSVEEATQQRKVEMLEKYPQLYPMLRYLSISRTKYFLGGEKLLCKIFMILNHGNFILNYVTPNFQDFP